MPSAGFTTKNAKGTKRAEQIGGGGVWRGLLVPLVFLVVGSAASRRERRTAIPANPR